MVVVLTKAEWNALSRLTTKIDDATKRRRSGADCAILVHPTAATAYKRRTGREITDWDSNIECSFDEADYKLQLIHADEVKFAKKGSSAALDDASPALLAILKSIGLGPDGVTEVTQGDG